MCKRWEKGREGKEDEEGTGEEENPILWKGCPCGLSISRTDSCQGGALSLAFKS